MIRTNLFIIIKGSTRGYFLLIALLWIGILLFSSALGVLGQAVGEQAAVVKTEVAAKDGLDDRIEQFEAKLAAMQAELDDLKQQARSRVVSPGSKHTSAGAVETASKQEPVPASKRAAAGTAAQQKQLGVDLGPVRLTPYGTIYFNAFNNSGAVNNQDVPLFAAASGQTGASASLRQTRLGVKLEGASVGKAKLSGVIEADFFGGFPTVGIGENFGVVRLRLANARLDWEKTSVTVGQDWMPFAPVNPTSIAAAAIPQLAAAGNNWARIPQVRVEQKLTSSLTWSAAVLAPQTGDHPASSTFFLQPNSGAASHTPYFQSRISFADKNWLGTGKAGSVGISGHYGRSNIAAFNEDIDSLGFALDWNFYLHKRVSLSGETFFGRNLAGFQAGVFQGVNTDFAYRNGNTVTRAGARSIGTYGGWIQMGFTPDVLKDRWSIYGSVGIDDPRDSDLTTVSGTNFRSRNLAAAFNTIYKVTPQFWIGAEYRHFSTRYFNTGSRTAEHMNLGATYSF